MVIRVLLSLFICQYIQNCQFTFSFRFNGDFDIWVNAAAMFNLLTY